MSDLINRPGLLATVQRDLMIDLGNHLKYLCDYTKKHRERNRFLRFILATHMTTHLNVVVSDFNNTLMHLRTVLSVVTHSVTLDINKKVHSTNKGLSFIVKLLGGMNRYIQYNTYIHTYIHTCVAHVCTHLHMCVVSSCGAPQCFVSIQLEAVFASILTVHPIALVFVCVLRARMRIRAVVRTSKKVERIEKTVNQIRDLALLAPAATITNDTEFTAANAPSLREQLLSLESIANIRYDAKARDALRAGVSKYALQPGQMRYFNENL
jgi:hypothetical protein